MNSLNKLKTTSDSALLSTPYVNINSPTSQGVPPLVKNQISPGLDEVEANNIKMSLKSNPQFLCCPYCKYQSISRAEKTCNTPNVLCCVLAGGISWVIFQAVRSKDINCYNADHFCIKCGNQLASYKAC